MPIQPIPERQTGAIKASLLDSDNSFVSGAFLETLTLSYYDLASGAIINGRDAQDALNQNDVTINGDGYIVWTITQNDTVIVNSQPSVTPVFVNGERVLGIEQHIAIFHGTWDGGAQSFTFQVTVPVINLGHLS